MKMIKLSILIPTTEDRKPFLKRLMDNLAPQVADYFPFIEVLQNDSPKPVSIGTKRNELLQRAKGKYVCFIDDDDLVAGNYINLLMEGITKDVDCCSLKGIITEDGNNPLIFEHALKYKVWLTNATSKEGEVRYERNPNHLNCIRASIAKQFSFPEKNQGEDHDWSTQVHKSGLIKSEHYIDQVIYYYDYRSNK